MAIQDRAFTSTGQLYYPAYANDILPGQLNDDGSQMRVKDVVPQAFYDAFGEDAPSVVPEFFGDTILVNGMAWPNQTVAAGTYEFRLLNGSDLRFYVLKLDDPNVKVPLWARMAGCSPMRLPSWMATACRSKTSSSSCSRRPGRTRIRLQQHHRRRTL